MRYQKYVIHGGHLYEDATYQVNPNGGDLGQALANTKKEGDATGRDYKMAVRGNDVNSTNTDDTVPFAVKAKNTADAAAQIRNIQSKTPSNLQSNSEYEVEITEEGYNVRMSYGSLKKLLNM